MKWILVILLSMACGKKETRSNKIQQESNETIVELELDHDLNGQFLSELYPLNKDVTGLVYGAFVFSRDTESTDDEIVIDIRLNNAGAEVVHIQYLKENDRCPTLADDLNGDGVIDIVEAELVMGKTLIPLDGDISAQAKNDGEFPVGNQYGNYIYSKFTRFEPFIKDLRQAYSPYPEYKKLSDTEALEIGNRSVLILGVDTKTTLPSSVQTKYPLSRHQSFPIACGILEKVLTPPGSIHF